MPGTSQEWVTFNPGPSQLSPRVIAAIQEIAASGYLSRSHRSKEFMEISRLAIEGLRKSMRIPDSYQILYQPSATIAIDTLLRNLVFKKSFHFVHGAFSNLFYQSACGIGLEAHAYNSDPDQQVDWEKPSIPADAELIAITHNETSTGLMWPSEVWERIKEEHPAKLIALDVTSSFGAMKMSWEKGDVFFGSVQKCLGLPSGLGFLIVSPQAANKSRQVLEHKKGVAPWQRLDVLTEKMSQFQTPETPNMLNIALLARQMAEWDLGSIEKRVIKNAKALYTSLPWMPYVKNEAWRSLTVANFVAGETEKWHQQALTHQVILGKGYGSLKQSCIRIANFPAITDAHMDRLFACLMG